MLVGLVVIAYGVGDNKGVNKKRTCRRRTAASSGSASARPASGSVSGSALSGPAMQCFNMVPGMVVDMLVATYGPNPMVTAGKKVSDAPPTKKNAMAAKKHDKPFFKRNEPEAPWKIRRLAREREKDAAAAKASAEKAAAELVDDGTEASAAKAAAAKASDAKAAAAKASAAKAAADTNLPKPKAENKGRPWSKDKGGSGGGKGGGNCGDGKLKGKGDGDSDVQFTTGGDAKLKGRGDGTESASSSCMPAAPVCPGPSIAEVAHNAWWMWNNYYKTICDFDAARYSYYAHWDSAENFGVWAWDWNDWGDWHEAYTWNGWLPIWHPCGPCGPCWPCMDGCSCGPCVPYGHKEFTDGG